MLPTCKKKLRTFECNTDLSWRTAPLAKFSLYFFAVLSGFTQPCEEKCNPLVPRPHWTVLSQNWTICTSLKLTTHHISYIHIHHTYTPHTYYNHLNMAWSYLLFIRRTDCNAHYRNERIVFELNNCK